ncbi:MAG: DUF559 domain-containing protein [Actinomycetota bacterium]
MVDEAVAALAATQYLLFARAQALGLGATEKVIEGRLRTGRWLPVLPGVYSLPGMAPSWRRDLMAACLQAGPGAVVSHEAAAALHGVDTFPPGPVVVTVAHGDHQHLRTGRLRQSTDLGPHHRTVVDGIPVTTPARTLVDLAAHTHPGRLRIALDSALAARTCSPEDVRCCLEELRRPGKRGLRKLGALLESRSDGRVPAPTTLERRLKRVLREGGLPAPVREHELPWARDTQGRVDFAYPRQRIIVEADSRRWHTRERDFEADRRRDREAQLAGWDVYRFTWDDLRTCPEDVVATVRRALALSSK